MKNNPKKEIVSFKVDEALADWLRSVPNRSEFIRAAIVSALEGACPLCHGTGILPPTAHEHWRKFLQTHQVRECEECRESYIVCGTSKESSGAKRAARG